MTDGLTTGLAWLSGLGLPQVLLWVLTFAVVFEILVKLKILSRAPAAIVGVITGLFILMAVPGSVIAAISVMSTGMIVAAIGFLVVLALIEVGQVRTAKPVTDEKGAIKGWTGVHPFTGHGTIMTLVVLGVGALIFFMAGGPALIGIGALPTIGIGTWVLIIVGVAVLWMVSESEKKM